MYWQGLQIWDLEPQREALDTTWLLNPENVEGLGVQETYAYEQYPRWRNAWAYVVAGREAIQDVEDFFDAHRGRLDPFWCPSWGNGYFLHSSNTFVHGAGGIVVDAYSPLVYDGDFRSRMPSRKRLRLRNSAGTTYYLAHVTAFDNVSYTDRDLLTLDVAYNSAYGFTTSDVQLDFMYCVRFDTDALAIRNLARDVYEVRLPMVEVPWETPGLTTY